MPTAGWSSPIRPWRRSTNAPVATTDEQKRAERETTLSPGAQKMLAQTLDRYASHMIARDTATLFKLR